MQDPSHKNQNHFVKFGFTLVFGFFILVALIYGFFTSFNSSSLTVTTPLEYIFTNVLAVLAFGLLLIHFKFGIQQTLMIAMLVCFVNILMGPMLQQFWYNVFTRGFGSGRISYPLMPGPIRNSQTEHINNVTLDFVRISAFCSISVFVSLTAVIGRIGLINTLITTIVFNVGWNLSYYLNYNIFIKNERNYFVIFDDLQGSRVFGFGAGFGVALIIMYSRFAPLKKERNSQYTDHLSTIFTLLGTIFTLAFLYFVLDTYTIGSKPNALLNIYFAFSTSIISSVAVSLIVGGVVTLEIINLAFLSGAIQISIIGTFILTPYVAMLVGVFSGAITSLLFLFYFDKLNRGYFRDSKGLIFVYLVNVLFCSFFVSPIIIKAYENDSKLGGSYFNQAYHMIYTAISIGVGFGFGLLAGLFRRCFDEDVNLSDQQFFNKSYNIPQVVPQKRRNVNISEAPTMELMSLNKTQTNLQSTYRQTDTGIQIRV